MPFSCESVALHGRSSTFQDDWHVISSCGNFASKLEAGASLGNWIVYLEPLSCWNSRVVPPHGAPGCWGSQHKGSACSTSNMPTKLYPRPIFFFSTDFFFSSITWERNHHFWLLVVLVHVLRIVGELKCLCSGLQHSQSSFSYERDASSEWTLATLGITPLCRNVPATRKWTTLPQNTPPPTMCTVCIIFQPHSYLLLTQEPETQRRQRPQAVAVGSAVVPSCPAGSPLAHGITWSLTLLGHFACVLPHLEKASQFT